MLLCFFNLVLRFAVFPSAWTSSLVVPLLKRDGGPALFDSYRPISLHVLSNFSSTWFMLASRATSPLDISNPKVVSAAVLMPCLTVTWTLCASAVTCTLFAAFVNIKTTPAGLKSRWFVSTTSASRVICGTCLRISFVATLSEVRVGGSASLASRKVGLFPPLLFNLLVDSLAATLRAAVPGVRLVEPSRLPAPRGRPGHFG